MRVSFEFFPPNTDQGLQSMLHVAKRLSVYKPEYFSVTYGAGGATQDKTLAAVRALVEQGYRVAPHLSCIGATRSHIAGLLELFTKLGIQRIVALRGDLPSGMVQGGDFRFASDLVRFIKETTADQFAVKVASYPEVHPTALSASKDLWALKQKFDAGASSAITQFFYNGDAYIDHVAQVRALGLTQEIVPGIMPIHNFASIVRFSEMCGAEIPRWLAKRMAECGDDKAAVRALGLSAVSALCQRLIDQGAPSLHFYTMNQADLTLSVLEQLR
jgi:methylenetetrahydrofolate reductase (NADPH)